MLKIVTDEIASPPDKIRLARKDGWERTNSLCEDV